MDPKKLLVVSITDACMARIRLHGSEELELSDGTIIRFLYDAAHTSGAIPGHKGEGCYIKEKP
jgi:hypothetical protein